MKYAKMKLMKLKLQILQLVPPFQLKMTTERQ